MAPGEEWDHKPILEDRLSPESKREFDLEVPGEDRSASYDIWSSIHYGCVGGASGIDAGTLITGASTGMAETVHRMSSPIWAFLMFRMAPPRKRVGEYCDSMNLFPPNKNVSSAEEVRYYCARRYLDSERCDEWYVWMRYGQYLVELDADALCSGDGSESHAEGESGNSRVVVRAGRAC